VEAFQTEPTNVSGFAYEGTRWLAAAVEHAGTLDDVNAIRAAFPPALETLENNAFDMANADETGDVELPSYVAYVQDGAIQGYTGN
jgi:hypothetical protein